MYVITVVVLVLTIYNANTQDIWVNGKKYNIELRGSFFLYEQHQDAVISNEYAAFLPRINLPLSTPIIETIDGKNLTIGYVIGSRKNYYPITPFENHKMWCGNFNFRKHAVFITETIGGALLRNFTQL